MKKSFFTCLILLTLSGILSCDKETSQQEKKIKATDQKVKSQKVVETVFERINSSESGIDFSNTIEDKIDTKENLFDYDFFYNGSGVGIADLNNDGLDDIFFTGNQVENRIYRNKGGLTFEDVTEKAGVNANKQWANGVTFADVNNDGWLDIYVCQGGPFEEAKRRNLLFINKQDMTFEEKAEEYGIADTGISTQAAFFDYDKDGDLDCIVSNENELYGLDPVRFHQILKNQKDLLEKSSAHLYRNDKGKFVNVTEKAGVLKAAFGLGLTVGDINEDGWLDFYIANDYYVPDVMYINNGDGTFSDKIKEATNQISFYGMGVDMEDINNDGHQDIFVLDMAANDHVRSKTLMASMNVPRFTLLTETLGFQQQYMYNSLQLNVGNHTFHNVAQYAKLSKTDWSWAGLIMDFNNDEYKEIYVTNGYRRYALDNDFQQKVRKAKAQYQGNVPRQVKEDLYYQMPSEKLSNILFQNDEKLSFKDKTGEWGLRNPSFSNGASYADLDGDGDFELVVNNIDEEAFLYKNLSVEKKLGNYLMVETEGRISESFAKVTIMYNGKTQFIESKRVKGYLSATDNSAHFGLGKDEIIDTVRVEWPSGKIEERYMVAANSFVAFKEGDAVAAKKSIDPIRIFTNDKNALVGFRHRENQYNDFEKEVLIPYKQSTSGPFMSKGDLNGDGQEDLYIGGASGQAGEVFLKTKGGFRKAKNPIFEKDALYEDMESVFFDIDGDQDLDLYVVSGGNSKSFPSELYQDRLYLNNGKGSFDRSKDEALEATGFSGGAVEVIDFDQDGDPDLLVSNRIFPQNYPKSPPNMIYENRNGKLFEVGEKVGASFVEFGMVNDILTTDFNSDGRDDFIAVGEWTGIGLFENKGGFFEEVSAKSEMDDENGWWFNITEIDVNKDGLKDYVLGNVGKNIKFKASKENRFKVFANDFDDNGTLDVVLSSKYNGEYVPARGRECSSQQMPFITEKFKTYNEFANATLTDVYGEKLDTSVKLEASEFRSLLIVNKGGGVFEKTILPKEAQLFPILDVEVMDLNNDGFDDLIAVGNIYNTEVETPRLDCGSGLVLISNGKDGFFAKSWEESGLYVPGNVKSLTKLIQDGKEHLLFGRNDNSTWSVRRSVR